MLLLAACRMKYKMPAETFSTLDVLHPSTAQLPVLPRAFYLQDTLVVAKRLLNCLLVHDSPEGLTVGRISETEAYTHDDPACHAFTRKTTRNAAMFGPPGHAYLHLNYGLHWCFNAVTAPEHIAEAVLVRALEPLVGVELMERRRGLAKEEPYPSHVDAAVYGAKMRVKRGNFLCGGPGKLSVAMGVTPPLNTLDLTVGHTLWIAPPLAAVGYAISEPTGDLTEASNAGSTNNEESSLIVSTTRIGITKAADYPWRFYLRGEPYISKR